MEIKQDKKDKSLNVPNFRYGLGTTHPINGTYTEIKFEDGSSGVILKPKEKPYEPLCKLTNEYKDKTFPTLWDAAVALYASIQEYGNPEYQEKLFCYELICQSFDNEDIKPLNLPMHNPHYKQMHAVGVYELKKAVYAYCCGVDEEERPKLDENAIIPKLLPVWLAFKKNGFDFYKFMVEKDYELIEDEEQRVEVLMGVCFPLLKLPIGRFAIDWLNGYLDFFERDSNLKCSDVGWSGSDDITDTDILYHLFFCSTEEEIWKIQAFGIGNIESMYNWYCGGDINPILEDATGIPCYYEKDERKASDFLDYLMSDSTGATENVRNGAMNLKKMADNTDRLREISKDLKNLFSELNINNPLETVFVIILSFVLTITI